MPTPWTPPNAPECPEHPLLIFLWIDTTGRWLKYFCSLFELIQRQNKHGGGQHPLRTTQCDQFFSFAQHTTLHFYLLNFTISPKCLVLIFRMLKISHNPRPSASIPLCRLLVRHCRPAVPPRDTLRRSVRIDPPRGPRWPPRCEISLIQLFFMPVIHKVFRFSPNCFGYKLRAGPKKSLVLASIFLCARSMASLEAIYSVKNGIQLSVQPEVPKRCAGVIANGVHDCEPFHDAWRVFLSIQFITW